MLTAELRPIPGHDGYFADAEGGVWSENGKNGSGLRRLRPASTGKVGYERLVLIVGSKRVTRLVHRLIASTFLGEPEPSRNHVRHLDGNARNNSVSNLAWGTRAENAADMIRHGRSRSGARSALARMTEHAAASIIARLDNGDSQTAIARSVGCSLSAVHHIKSGRSWSHLRRPK